MKTAKRWVGIYVRVSKPHGQESGKDSQIHELRRYAQEHGLTPYRIYCDKRSGASDYLPKLALLGRRIEQGVIHTVLTSEISRFSRKGIKDGLDLITPWLKHGIRIVSAAEGFDWAGDTGTLVASIFFWLAEQERKDIVRRTKRGLDRVKAQGRRLGPPVKLHASDIVPLLKDGMTATAAAVQLGCTAQGLYAALRREHISLEEARGATT